MVKFKNNQHTRAGHNMQRLAGVERLFFLTDLTRVADPVAVCKILPRETCVILRDYDHPDRTAWARALRRVTRSKNQKLLIAGDIKLARRVGADGVHLPEYQLQRNLKPDGFTIVTAACHDRRALMKASKIGVDFALVSPVFPTQSHVGARHLGLSGLKKLQRMSCVPVVALGGLNEKNVASLKGSGLAGVAAIDGLSHRLA